MERILSIWNYPTLHRKSENGLLQMNILKFKELPYQGRAIQKVTGKHFVDWKYLAKTHKPYAEQIKRLRNQPEKLQKLIKRLDSKK